MANPIRHWDCVPPEGCSTSLDCSWAQKDMCQAVHHFPCHHNGRDFGLSLPGLVLPMGGPALATRLGASDAVEVPTQRGQTMFGGRWLPSAMNALACCPLRVCSLLWIPRTCHAQSTWLLLPEYGMNFRHRIRARQCDRVTVPTLHPQTASKDIAQVAVQRPAALLTSGTSPYCRENQYVGPGECQE